MAVHNAQTYLSEAVDSLLFQTLADFELVIVDDGSTDQTASLLESYARRDARLVLLRSDDNAGLSASLNRGIAECRASLVARADADDVYAPDRLELQVGFMDRHPDIGLLSTGYHQVNDKGELVRTVRPPTADTVIRFRQLFMNSFLHPGVMFRTGLVREVGGYDTSYWTAQDSELWARLRPHTRMANLPQPLVRYRVHDDSIMRTRGAEGQALSLSVPRYLLGEYLARPLDLSETRAVVTLFQGFEAMEADDVELGLCCLAEVLRRAQKVEDAATVSYYRAAVGRSLLRQAEYQKDQHGTRSRSLIGAAVRWSPRLSLSRRFYRGVAQALVPAALRRTLRR